MPAVTVDDLTVLDRLRVPGLGDTVRPVKQLIDAPKGYEGEGFPVRRAFAGVDLRDLDPFVHMDQMGEVEYAPGEPKGTPWHPHRGFETVTYIIDGVFDHHDSHGGGGTITDGDTQWMTAGSGLLHIETPPEWLVQSGGLFHGIQLWVNLPRDAKWNPPAYQDIRSGQVGLATSADAGALVRVIAGDVGATKGPGLDVHPDDDGARDSRGGRATRPALGGRVQRARLCPLRPRQRRRRQDSRADRQPGRARRRRLRHCQCGRQPGEPYAGPRCPRDRRPANPRAGRLGRTVRDEHQGRGADGVRGLPEGHGSARSRACTALRPRRSRPRTEFRRPGGAALVASCSRSSTRSSGSSDTDRRL